MKIERHVFGSYKGYTTLAKSSGISAEDARQLEGGVYGFGQTEDRRYAKSLRARPAFFTRVLSGGRRGLTRVFEGAPDSDGRPTNVMITAVLSNSDWDGKLCGDVWLLLPDKQVWQWAGGSEMSAVNRSYPAPPTAVSRKAVGRIAALISEIERRWGVGPAIIVGGEFGSEEIRAMEMLVPAKNRPQFTSASRSLSPQLAVTLNRLAAEASAQQINFRYDANLPNSPYAEFLLEYGLAEGRLPIAEAMTYRDFGRGESKAPAAKRMYVPPPMPAEERRNGWIIWGAVALVGILLIGGVYAKWRRTKLASDAMSSLAIGQGVHSSATKNDPPTTRDILTRGEVQTANVALAGKSGSTAGVSSAPSTRSLQLVGGRSDSTQEPIALATRKSKQDRDLANLERRWEDFFGLIGRESLTFSDEQTQELSRLEREMRSNHLTTRVEVGATGSIEALPVILDLRDQYFRVNQLLSDPNIKDVKKLRGAEGDLEILVKRLKTLLNSLSAQPEIDPVIFSKIDRTIIANRQRLKELEKGGG